MNIAPADNLVTPDIDLETLRHDCESLCRSLTPADLAARPVYTVFSSDMPEEYRGRYLNGCAGSSLDESLREWIGDRWQGRGPAIFLNDAGIVEQVDCPLGFRIARESFPDRRREMIRGALFDTTVHEWSHHAEIDFEQQPVSSAIRASNLAWIKLNIRHHKPINNGPSPEIPFADHGWEFLRCACHLVHRAKTQGYAIEGSDVVSKWCYSISPLEEYAAALSDEPARMMDSTFKVINETPPPLAFARLWHSDTTNWLAGVEADGRSRIIALWTYGDLAN